MAGLRLQDLQMAIRWTVKAEDSHTAGSGNYHQIGPWKPSGFPSFYNFRPRKISFLFFTVNLQWPPNFAKMRRGHGAQLCDRMLNGQ